MDRVVSGIRPTGYLHLGNYFGALRNFIKMQEENECFFFIADYAPSIASAMSVMPASMAML